MSDELREKVAKALWRADVKGVDERGLTWTRSLSEDHYRELADVAIAVMQPQIDAMAEQCRRVYLDWETAVQARDAAIAAMKPDDGLKWTVVQRGPKDTNPGWWEASVVDDTYAGWALQKTEAEARNKALLRLRTARIDAAITEHKRAEMGYPKGNVQ